MLAKADEFVTKTKAELNEARQLKTDCDQQKQTLQKEQQELLGRLGGVKRAASDDSCSICLSAAKTHLLTPCGHKCMCEQCAGAIARVLSARSAVAGCRASCASMIERLVVEDSWAAGAASCSVRMCMSHVCERG